MTYLHLLTILAVTINFSNAQAPVTPQIKTQEIKATQTQTQIQTQTQAVKVKDKTQEYAQKYDFSELLKPETKFLGFIAPNYKKMQIEFNRITKKDAKTYFVEGQSTVGENTCEFSGPLTIKKIKEDPDAKVQDEGLKDMEIQGRGELIANYEFKEQQKEKVCGVFKGQMTLLWYINREGEIEYDDLEESMSDKYKNNQYKGTWTAYGEKKSKKANWGEYRIPDSGDLDIGAGEFGVNPKYRDNGW